MSQAYGRPFRPTELTASTVTSFALPAMAQQLMAEDAFQHAGRNALTLARGSDLTVVLMVLKAQSELHEHQAPGPITVTALSGHLEFEAAAQSRGQDDDAMDCVPNDRKNPCNRGAEGGMRIRVQHPDGPFGLDISSCNDRRWVQPSAPWRSYRWCSSASKPTRI